MSDDVTLDDWLVASRRQRGNMSAARDEFGGALTGWGATRMSMSQDRYDAAMDEIDRLRAECQLQRNLLGNATGAALDVGLAGDVTAHDAIYLLAAERDVLRQALVKWLRAARAFDNAPHGLHRSEYDELDHADTVAESALFALVPDDCWGLGVTGGEPER